METFRRGRDDASKNIEFLVDFRPPANQLETTNAGPYAKKTKPMLKGIFIRTSIYVQLLSDMLKKLCKIIVRIYY